MAQSVCQDQLCRGGKPPTKLMIPIKFLWGCPPVVNVTMENPPMNETSIEDVPIQNLPLYRGFSRSKPPFTSRIPQRLMYGGFPFKP